MLEEANLEWPAARAELGEQMEHLSQREYECSFYAHRKLPFESSGSDSGLKLVPEYMDVNESIQRSCGPSGQNSPWKTMRHTLTCAGFTSSGISSGRVLRSDSSKDWSFLAWWDTATYMAAGKHPSHQVATRMAGNAFSGFAVAAALFGLLFSLRREASSDAMLSDSDAESCTAHKGSALNLELDLDSIS